MVENRRVEYKASVQGDLRRLGPAAAVRVINQIERTFSSGTPGRKPLTGEFVGLFRLRVGDYRVIYARTHEGFLVLRIAHRREIYRRGRPQRRSPGSEAPALTPVEFGPPNSGFYVG